MFKTKLVTGGRIYHRGTYETLRTALTYGQKDYNNYRNILATFGKQDTPHKMVILAPDGKIIHTFTYNAHA
jgi:hypothetical protein